jgi:hypothetical protein
MVRSDVEYIGQYRSSSRARQVLRSLGASTSVVVDWTMFNWFSSSFELVLERDNKSVWTPEWVRTGLSRFGSNIPTALVEWEYGGFDPSKYSAAELGRDGRSQRSSSGIPNAGVPASIRTKEHSAASTTERLGRGTISSKSGDARRPEGTSVAVDATRRSTLSNRVLRRSDRTPLRIDTIAYEHAKAATISCAGGREGRREPYTLSQVVDKVIHRSHFSGAPYFSSNADALESALLRAEQIQSGRIAMDPYVAGRRIQHGPSGPKGRLVWMAPLATSIVASRYSKAVYDGLRLQGVFAYGTRKLEVGGFISELQSRFKRVYSLDFSGFDSTLPAFVIDDVFRIIKSWLILDDAEERILDRVIHDFIHSRIILPDGSMWQVHRGVPSGNPFTSLVDSIANLLIINYCLIRTTGVALKMDRVMILGDDSVFGTNHYVPLPDIAKAAAELGMVLSVEKSKIAALSQRVEFLGHEWSHGRPYRPLWDLVQRMVFPERHLRRTKSDSLIRFYSYSADAEDWITLLYQVRKNWGSYLDMVRALLQEADVGDEITFESGPGRLRYLENIEPDLLPADVRRGPALAVYGTMF